MELVIDSPATLESLRARGARRGVSRIVLAFPHDSRDARIINRGLRVCGCEVGAIFLTAAVVFLAVAAGGGWRPRWWVIAVILAGATITGKAIGIALAEWRLRAALARLR
jgi:hypothetical protein